MHGGGLSSVVSTTFSWTRRTAIAVSRRGVKMFVLSFECCTRLYRKQKKKKKQKARSIVSCAHAVNGEAVTSSIGTHSHGARTRILGRPGSRSIPAVPVGVRQSRVQGKKVRCAMTKF